MDLNERPDDAGFLRHPWEVVRAEFFTRVLGEIIGSRPTALLDVGAGDGWFASQLVERYPTLSVTCFDPGYGENPPPGHDRLRFISEEPAGRFGILTLLDVIEHVEDDTRLLGDSRERLDPGGYLVISVPAWPRLFSRHDVALKHFRRYTPALARERLQSSGFEVLQGGGLFYSLLAPRSIGVMLERLRTRSQAPSGEADHALEWRGGRSSRRLIETALRADTRLSQLTAGMNLQIPGLSWWGLCRRMS